jgi:hypothetical protein
MWMIANEYVHTLVHMHIYEYALIPTYRKRNEGYDVEDTYLYRSSEEIQPRIGVTCRSEQV